MDDLPQLDVAEVGEELERAQQGETLRVEHALELAARHLLVPVTTRTVAQFARIALPSPARHAVCANGGVLLVDGERDAAWADWVRATCAVSAPLAEVEAKLGKEIADAATVAAFGLLTRHRA